MIYYKPWHFKYTLNHSNTSDFLFFCVATNYLLVIIIWSYISFSCCCPPSGLWRLSRAKKMNKVQKRPLKCCEWRKMLDKPVQWNHKMDLQAAWGRSPQPFLTFLLLTAAYLVLNLRYDFEVWRWCKVSEKLLSNLLWHQKESPPSDYFYHPVYLWFLILHKGPEGAYP